jgi:glycosyltransferase involved in cell wall biosynthesis
LGSRIINNDDTFPLHLGKLIYLATLKKTYSALPKIEAAGVPFVFTLCPNDGFVLGDPDVDRQLKRIFGSPRFESVIVTQQAIYDYVVGIGICPKEKIELIHGGVMPEISEELSIPKRRWGFTKARLDICFVAHQYAPYDKDMGYGLFVEVAKALQIRHDDICFHAVGALSPCAIDVSSLGDRIKFYGSLTADKFDTFFQDMDIILSPTGRSDTPLGVIDNFPTEHCVEAGVRGVSIFTADDFNAAKGRFTDGEDIVIVKPKAGDIIDKIERYYAAPEALKAIGEKGAQSIRELYGQRAQMAPRINLLREAIRNSAPVGEDLALKVKIAAMQAEIARRDELLALVTVSRMKRKRKLSLLLRGLRRLLTGRSNTTARQIFEVYHYTGFKGVRRALRNIGV